MAKIADQHRRNAIRIALARVDGNLSALNDGTTQKNFLDEVLREQTTPLMFEDSQTRKLTPYTGTKLREHLMAIMSLKSAAIKSRQNQRKDIIFKRGSVALKPNYLESIGYMKMSVLTMIKSEDAMHRNQSLPSAPTLALRTQTVNPWPRNFQIQRRAP